LIRDVVERAQIRGGTQSAVEPYLVTKGSAATELRGGIESGSGNGGDIGEVGGIHIELGGQVQVEEGWFASLVSAHEVARRDRMKIMTTDREQQINE